MNGPSTATSGPAPEAAVLLEDTMQSDEVDVGNYRTTGVAVGALGLLGVVLGVAMALLDLGDERIVSAPPMMVTGLVLTTVGSALWWTGRQA